VTVASSNSSRRVALYWSFAHDDRVQVVDQAVDGDPVGACRAGFDVAQIGLAIHGLGVLGEIGRLRRSEPSSATGMVAHTDAVYLRRAVAAESAVDCLVMPDDLDELPDRLLAVDGAATPSLVPGSKEEIR
jgi:hypothetical protein